MGYRRRTKRIYSGVTPEQYADICDRAERMDITASEWIYQAVKSGLKQRRPRRVPR